MSDSTPEAPPAEPDFLDRLIARHTAPRPAASRVRPRLPGPFERVEAVRARTPDPGTADPATWPFTVPAAAADQDAPGPAGTVGPRYTERERTVVHTRQAPAAPAARPAPAAPVEAPLLRPVAPPAPGPLPMPRPGPRTPGPGRPEPRADRAAASPPTLPGRDADPTAVVSATAHPSPADTTAARDAVRMAAARRPARAPEQVVQVQIGRLEVTAGQAPSGGRAPSAARSAERPGAALSLADYLARGRE
ncbi:hypothetical protein ACWD5R_03040 [Streptomyces sp. NPDC002514]|uniref:hypothetical protein n=1 Tax=Streptomyces sp. NPDC001270 TaxID=3364554 RepID=UPI00369B9538